MKHTKGPWVAEHHSLQSGDASQNQWFEIRQDLGKGERGVTVAKMRGWTKEEHDNAQLVASAPKLLETLYKLTEFCTSSERYEQKNPYGSDQVREACGILARLKGYVSLYNWNEEG